MSARGWETRSVATLDGLTLHMRDWPAAEGSEDATPILCLPGLTRSGADFEELTAALRARGEGRRVLALDFRGRGQSDRAEDYSTYNPLQEAGDAIGAIAQTVGGPVAIVGTSRGGLVGMIIGLARPDLFAGLVLNDVGPVIDTEGASRIMQYLGVPIPDDLDWEGAAARIRDGLEAEFPGLDDAFWAAHARRTFRDEDGRPRMNYDLKLREATLDQAAEAPADLWPQYDALPKDAPMLVIRGENSDILSTETVQEMIRRREGLEAVQLADRGHAPFLHEAPAVEAIAAWLGRVDEAAAKSANAEG
jgi:pimeloyl-ACP methyl ester carboxylesterase